MKGNTQVEPEAGPEVVTQLEELELVVVDTVVVVEVVAVVVEVVTVVVVVPDELLAVVVVVVVVVVVDPALGQVEGQKPYLSVTKLPPASTSVEHQAEDWSTVAHSVYTTPLYLGNVHPLLIIIFLIFHNTRMVTSQSLHTQLIAHLKGKTQALPDSGPEAVVQEGTVMASSVQPEVADTEQSPQL